MTVLHVLVELHSGSAPPNTHIFPFIGSIVLGYLIHNHFHRNSGKSAFGQDWAQLLVDDFSLWVLQRVL